MSQEGLARLEEIVRAVVTSPEEVPGSTMTLLAAEFADAPEASPRCVEGTQRPRV
jgi:hypothetical protein